MSSVNWSLQPQFVLNSYHSLLKVVLFSTIFCTSIIGADAENPTHKVYITTGDRKSDGAAWKSINFDIVMTDSTGRESRIQSLVGDHKSVKKGQTEQYDMILADVEYIKSIAVKRTDTIKSQDWFVDLVKVDYLDVDHEGDDDLIIHSSYFPIHRWLHHDEHMISEYDSVLPQDDENADARKEALRRKREMYRFSGKVHGGPPLVETLPDDEKFSEKYINDIFTETSQFSKSVRAAANHTPNFESLSDIEQLYRGDYFHVPERMTDWAEDAEFGRQKLTGTNPGLIKLCTELPELMEKAIGDIEQNLPSGSTFADSVKNKRVYMIDLSFMANVECAEPIPGAVALFHVADNGDLMPIAIQLSPDEDAPVFTPKDSRYTWMAAKMWFNNAEGSHHQAAAHLGLTHLLIETVGVATHRQLSQSHPVFRFLAPHIRYVMHINWRGVYNLLPPGGTIDQTMRMGRNGMFNIIKNRYSEWSLQNDGNFMKNLKHRGVQNVTNLPGYHYREDGKLLWVALQKYVTKSIRSYYGQGAKGNERLGQDNELQGWINELVSDSLIKGMPVKYRNGKYFVKRVDDLVEIVTTFVFISTVQHAAVNYQQYDSYGFIPNNPIALRGDWPRTKAKLTERDVVNMLPSKEQTIKIMILVTQLSIHGTEKLGDFEIQYAYDPASLTAAQELRDELKDIEAKLARRNKKRKDKYRYLMPRYMPNCINI